MQCDTVSDPPPSTTTLGDWYAHILFTKPQVVLCVSEHGRLPIVMPAREIRTVAARLPLAAARVLVALGIGRDVLEHELTAMRQVVFAKTASRSMLSTINDFAIATRWALADHPEMTFEDVSLELAETPVEPMNYDHPAAVVRRLFSTAGR